MSWCRDILLEQPDGSIAGGNMSSGGVLVPNFHNLGVLRATCGDAWV